MAHEESVVVGYSSRLFLDDELALRVDSNEFLLHLFDDESLGIQVDRYDVRNLMDPNQLRLASVSNNSNIYETVEEDESQFDYDRYRDLQESESEDDSDSQNTSQSKEESTLNVPEAEPKETVKIKFRCPDSMAIPQTQRIANLIEKTATFINSSANSQTEVLIRSKQSSNPDFGFLMRDHSLYPYFQHVRSLLKMGLGGYASDDSNSDADESESKQDNESNDSDVQGKEGDSNADILKEPDVERVDLTDEEANVIEKTAKFVAKNGSKFEDVVRERNQGNSRFDFLIPSNPLNRYYKMRVLFYS